MKRQILGIIFISCYLILAGNIVGQKASSSSTADIIENSDKPLHPRAGRIITLEEVMRIKEATEDYYFKYPNTYKIAPDGSIFIEDENQLLRFDAEGKFLQNYFKSGQGPGEMQHIRGYSFHGQSLIVQSGWPNKIIWFDLKGDFIKEFPIRNVSFIRFQFYKNNKYYFFHSSIPDTKGKPMVVEVPHDLICISQEGEKTETMASFPVTTYAVGSGGGGAAVSMGELIAVPFKDKYLFISHTPEYLIKLYDVESKTIIRQFRRSYPRVKWPKEKGTGSIGWNGKYYKPPPRKYVNDIETLLIVDDSLWIMTSLRKEKKGALFDVYDFEGEYQDSFFIKFTERGSLMYVGYMMVSQNFLYKQELNEDETVCVVKYKMIDSNDSL